MLLQVMVKIEYFERKRIDQRKCDVIDLFVWKGLYSLDTPLDDHTSSFKLRFYIRMTLDYGWHGL